MQPLELVFESAEKLMMFVTGVQLFINDTYKHMHEGTIRDRRLMQLRDLWAEADTNADNKLDLREIERLAV